MRYTDRSRVELDWSCPRARYYGYEYEGLGLRPMTDAPELAFGGGIAEQLHKIKLGEAWSLEAFTGEERLLAEALLIGYETVVWPRWQEHFDVVSIEEEQPKQLVDWLIYNSRPDTVTRRKRDGALFYGPEDKTTAWLDSLLTYGGNIQLHATAMCIESNRPEERVAGCLVQGLYKGFTKEGKLYHPLVYGYVKEGRAGIVPDQWSSKWVRGWERAPVTQFVGGVKAWIAGRSQEDLLGVFPNSQPVTPNRPLVEKYFTQVIAREGAVAKWHLSGRDPVLLDHLFPQHFNQCNEFGKSRKRCAYYELCWNATARRFPMTFYKHRVPHHLNEAEALKA